MEMKTRITELVVKAAAVAGLAVGLAFGGGLGDADAQQGDADNYFELHPGPVFGQTGIDPNDPYAPVDLSGSGGATDGTGNARAGAEQSAADGETAGEWSSSPRLPGQPF
jgi:hypothetical protein